MPASTPTLFYDLGSPYAYLAVERAPAVLGVEPRLEPVLVGGIFVLRGHGSWSQTRDRAGRIAEVEARAERYGLAPLRWPPGWPNNTLKAMRAVIWAELTGAGERFAKAAFRQAFAEGRDLCDIEVLAEIADSVGLAGGDLGSAIEQATIKDALKQATTRAWEQGVIGVPCIGIGEKIFYGDDQLEFAAESSALRPVSSNEERNGYSALGAQPNRADCSRTSARLIEKLPFDAVEDGLQAELEALDRGAVAEVVG